MAIRYFKAKMVITAYTILHLRTEEEENPIFYDRIDNMEYYGVRDPGLDFLQKQHPECEVAEVQFDEIKSILKKCRLMQQFNETIRKNIAKKYDLSDEIGLTNGDHTLDDYKNYRAYVKSCKDEINLKKVEYGLKQ